MRLEGSIDLTSERQTTANNQFRQKTELKKLQQDLDAMEMKLVQSSAKVKASQEKLLGINCSPEDIEAFINANKNSIKIINQQRAENASFQ